MTLDLDKLEQLERAATPGPWKYDWGNWAVERQAPGQACHRDDVCSLTGFGIHAPTEEWPSREIQVAGNPHDGDLIAEARNQLPELLSYVRRLERVAEAARAPSLRWNEEYCSRQECEYMTADWERLDDALAALGTEPAD